MNYTDVMLEEVLNAVADGAMSLREAEERYNVSRSTLSQKMHRKNPLKLGE